MNAYISILIILVCLFFIVSATTAYVVKDATVKLSNFQTYRWIETRSTENDPSSRPSIPTDLRIHDTIQKELNKWGWRETSEKPDILVSYDVLIDRIKERDKQAASYSDSFTRFYYNEFCERWSAIEYPSQFVGYDVYEIQNERSGPADKATLTITLLETETDKKIWQGWTTEKLRDKKLTEREIQRSVNAIFRRN